MRNRRGIKGLRIIDGTGARAETFISFDQAREVGRERRPLQDEAENLEAEIGKNPYSEYILKNRQYPPPGTAGTIGRLLGRQVKASDGSMQPPRTKAQRTANRRVNVERRAQYQKLDQIERLCTALACLSANDKPPQSLIGEICYLHEQEIVERLEKSLQWLLRFVEEWNKHCGNSALEFRSQIQV